MTGSLVAVLCPPNYGDAGHLDTACGTGVGIAFEAAVLRSDVARGLDPTFEGGQWTELRGSGQSAEEERREGSHSPQLDSTPPNPEHLDLHEP